MFRPTRTTLTVLLLGIGLFTTTGVTQHSTSNKYERETLRALGEVNVVVEELTQGEVEVDLPVDEYKQSIEEHAESLGIEIVGPKEARDRGNILALTVSVMRPDSLIDEAAHLYVYTIDLSMRQRVALWRRRWAKTSAITWYGARTGIAREDGLHPALKDNLTELLRAFEHDYRKANE